MSKEKVTFLEAIAKFIHIGEVYYNNHYYDNVLNIFDELTEEDRKELLRAVYQIFVLVEKGVIENPLRPSRQREGIPEERTVDASMTASSTFIIVLLVFLLLLVVSIFFIVGMDTESGASFKVLFKLIGFMFS